MEYDGNNPLCRNTIPIDIGCEVPCGEPITSCDYYYDDGYALQFHFWKLRVNSLGNNIVGDCGNKQNVNWPGTHVWDHAFGHTLVIGNVFGGSLRKEDLLPIGSREYLIIALMSQITNSSLPSQTSPPQVMTVSWVINGYYLVLETSPTDERRSLLQRYDISVLNFFPNGDDWLYCLARGNLECGTSRFTGRESFLSNSSE